MLWFVACCWLGLSGAAGAAGAPPHAALDGSRLALRQALLESLNPLATAAAPADIDDPLLADNVHALEATLTQPATSFFLALGIGGTWHLRATGRAAAANAALDAYSATDAAPRPLAVGALGAHVAVRRAQVDMAEGGRVLSTASFDVAEPDGSVLAGTLRVESTAELVRDRADSLRLRGLGRQLALPSMPRRLGIPELMECLHAQLSADFSLVEGDAYALQLITTYLDDKLWIVRSAGMWCSVWERLEDPEG